MDIHGYHPRYKGAPMAKKKKSRPGILVRMYPSDIANLNLVCADRCTPRENYARRCILAQVSSDLLSLRTKKGAKP